MSQGIPRIEEFPGDDRYWRVDWFGAIERNPNVPSEPYVQLVISPLIQNEDIHSTAKHLASTYVTEYEKAKSHIDRRRPTPFRLYRLRLA